MKPDMGQKQQVSSNAVTLFETCLDLCFEEGLKCAIRRMHEIKLQVGSKDLWISSLGGLLSKSGYWHLSQFATCLGTLVFARICLCDHASLVIGAGPVLERYCTAEPR
jgi:hypothetical protein